MGSTFKILKISKIINYDYLLLVFKLNRDLYRNSKIGAAIPHLNKQLFKGTLIALPPLDEQKRIVDRILLIDPNIDTYSTYENKLMKLDSSFKERFKKSILEYAIQGKLVKQDPNDEPASVLLDKIKQEKENLIKQGIIKRDKASNAIKTSNDKNYYEKYINIPFNMNNGFWLKLNDIAFVTKLAGFEYTQYISKNLVTDGVPLFKGKNIKDSKIIYDFENYIQLDLSNKLKRSQVNKKCLLTPYVGTIGNVAIHNKPGIYHLGSNVAKIELFNGRNKNILEEFILYYLKSIYGYNELTKHKKATAQESISIEAIKDVFIPVYSINYQEKIVQKLDLVINKINIL